MKTTLLFLLVLTPLIYCPDSGARIIMVQDGQPAAVVVVADEASKTAVYAAEELIVHVARATGANLPLAVESNIPDGFHSRLYIGLTQAAAALGIAGDELGPDEFILRSKGENLYILGMEDPDRDLLLRDFGRSERNMLDTGIMNFRQVSKNGTLFGVYELLDRFVGVRWLWPGELGTYVPPAEHLTVDEDLDELHKPSLAFRIFRWREVFYAARGDFEDPLNLAFSPAAMRAYWRDLGIYYGRHRMGQSELKPRIGHYFSGWWQRYGRDNPEWFSLDRDGNRGHPDPAMRHVSMCVSNPELHRYIVEEAWDGGDNLSLGEVDRRGKCQCDDCRSWDSPQPEQYPASLRADHEPQMTSNRHARFWKTIYEMAVARNPNVRITTFLYWSYLPAPTSEIELNRNIHGDFVPWTGNIMFYPMPEEEDRWLREQWKGWRDRGISIAYRPNLLLSGYVMPDLTTWQAGDFFRFAYEHGMVGIDFDSLAGHWAMRGPMLYMYMRLAWYPELEIETVRKEYFSAFGPAADLVEGYFDYWEDYSAGQPGRVSYNHVRNVNQVYPEEVFIPAGKILDQALIAAQSHSRPEYAERVEFLQAGLEHARLCSRMIGNFKQGTPPVHPTRLRETREAIEELIAFRRQHEHLYIANFRRAASLEYRSLAYLDQILAEPEPVMELMPLRSGSQLAELPDLVGVRPRATYLLHATANEKVGMAIVSRNYGPFTHAVSYIIQSPSGDIVRQGEVPAGEREDFEFTAGQAGTYTISASAGRGVMAIASTGRMAILQPDDRLDLVAPNTTLYFYVPAGTASFELEVAGREVWAKARAALIDPEDRVIEEKDNITGLEPHLFSVAREASAAGEVWGVRLSRPGEGYYQNVYLKLSEPIPPLLGLGRETMIVPK